MRAGNAVFTVYANLSIDIGRYTESVVPVSLPLVPYTESTYYHLMDLRGDASAECYK